MRIGDLNKRIDIEASTKVSDGMGGFTVAWTAVASSIAAAIWPVSASEIVQAAQPTMLITHRIRIRYRSGIKASFRIKFGNSYFNIYAIIDANMGHRYLDLMVKEAAK